MNNFRRRALLGGGSIDYVFSARSTSINIDYNTSSWNIGITSTANGTNKAYSLVSCDGTVVTAVGTNTTYITMYYSVNSTYNKRNGSVVLKQNDSNKTITITVSQAAHPLYLDYDGILLDGTSGSDGSISFDSNGSTVGFSYVPSWATVTYSSGKINVTASSTNSSSMVRSDTITVSAGSQSTSLFIIQLPSDYHSRSYVSIGGINWAIKNVGASSVQDYGNYYMYGKGSRTYTYGDSKYEGMENPLASSADTATQVMGSGWMMPTKDELEVLISSTSYYWVSYNGVNGGVFYTGGNVLFFPAAGLLNSNSLIYEGSNGYVWSSTPDGSNSAYCLNFIHARSRVKDGSSRLIGHSVRGVQA